MKKQGPDLPGHHSGAHMNSLQKIKDSRGTVGKREVCQHPGGQKQLL